MNSLCSDNFNDEIPACKEQILPLINPFEIGDQVSVDGYLYKVVKIELDDNRQLLTLKYDENS